MKIALISADPSFGNAPGIYRALSTCAEVVPVFRRRDSKEMWKQIPDALYGYENIPEDVDQYVIVSAQSYVEIRELLLDKPIRVILTDTYYLENYNELNEELRHHIIYCMPDLMKYFGEARTFYHPFEWNNWVIKSEVYTISHSPSNAPKQLVKGTAFITEVVEELEKEVNIQYNLITNKTWWFAVNQKAHSHLFIDQVISNGEYKGGLGKSGIEAMVLENMVFTSGEFFKTDLPLPPVEIVIPENLKEKLVYYIRNEGRRIKRVAEQRSWADKYCSYEFIGKHLLK